MMRLSTMWRVDSTIADDGSSPIAQRILERWDHDPGSVRFFRSSANFLYAFQHQGQDHFLRFSDTTERSRGSVDAEVDLVAWLANAGIEVALPVPSTQGNQVETVSTEWGEFHATVLPAMTGQQFGIEDLDAAGFRRWGAELARLHTVMTAYPGKDARSTWEDHLNMARHHLPRDSPALHAELDEITSVLNQLPVTSDNYGMIHSDFELDNLVWQNQSAGILDVDECTRMWFAADIAFALGDLFEEKPNLDDERYREFVEGYASHRPLDNETLSCIPVFIRLDNLLQYARLVRTVDLQVGPEHPAWLHALHRKLDQWMVRYSASIPADS